MKKYIFEIELTERDLIGDEFFEQALDRDGTGIASVTEAVADALADSNLMAGSNRLPKDVVKLVKYTDE